MPVAVQWNRRGSDEFVGVGKVDEEIREWAGLPPDPDNYSVQYLSLSYFVIGALMHSGGIVVEKQEVEDHKKRCELESDSDFYDEWLLRRFKVQAYRPG